LLPGPERAPRRERKKRETHARVLAEARRLLAVQGYSATSMEQIADAADVAPATVFNYFPAKDALVAALASDVFDGLRALLDRPPLPGCSPQDEIARALEAAVPLVREAHELLGPLLLRVLRQPGKGSTRDGVASLRSAFSRLFVAGQRRGDVRSDIEASFLAELASASLVAALGHWLIDPRYPLDARMCQAAAVIGDGLRAASNSTHIRRAP
jgi:AcrR family transcriptional regulator